MENEHDQKLDLSVVVKGTSGIEIRAPLSKKYNLIEFTLSDAPQPIFISPWMQFEPSEMNDERTRIAYEIVRRVTNYDTLLKQITTLKRNIESSHDRDDRARKQFDTAISMWREERKKFGLPDDFSDIKDWPPEMMSNYV